MLDQGLDRMLKQLYVEIDATEEQKAKLAPIVKDAVKDLLPMHEKLQAARSCARSRGGTAARRAVRATVRGRVQGLSGAAQREKGPDEHRRAVLDPGGPARRVAGRVGRLGRDDLSNQPCRRALRYCKLIQVSAAPDPYR